MLLCEEKAETPKHSRDAKKRMPAGKFQKGGGKSELEQACLSGVPPSCVTEEKTLLFTRLGPPRKMRIARLFPVGQMFIIDEHGVLLKGIFIELKIGQ